MPRHYKFDIWDVIIWISLLILIAYIIAKLTGLINTPEWVNLIPLITLVFFAGAFYQKVMLFMSQMQSRTNYLKKGIDNLTIRVDKTNIEFTNLSSQIKGHDEELKKVNLILEKPRKKQKRYIFNPSST